MIVLCFVEHIDNLSLEHPTPQWLVAVHALQLNEGFTKTERENERRNEGSRARERGAVSWQRGARERMTTAIQSYQSVSCRLPAGGPYNTPRSLSVFRLPAVREKDLS